MKLKPRGFLYLAVLKPELKLTIDLLHIFLTLLRTPLGRTLNYLLCLTSATDPLPEGLIQYLEVGRRKAQGPRSSPLGK